MTPEANLIRSVRVAMPARTVSGVEMAYSGRWVLAECDHVDTELVGQYRLVDDLPNRSGVGQHRPRVVLGDVAEGVESELELATRTVL